MSRIVIDGAYFQQVVEQRSYERLQVGLELMSLGSNYSYATFAQARTIVYCFFDILGITSSCCILSLHDGNA